MLSQFKQRLLGFALLVCGAGLTAWCWYSAVVEGRLYKVASAFGPAAAVLGAAFALFPIDEQEMLKRHGVKKPHNLNQYPPVLQAMILVALLAGLANFLAIWFR
jgi:hypothetical protein